MSAGVVKDLVPLAVSYMVEADWIEEKTLRLLVPWCWAW